jgi:hypothetical protein
MEDAHGSHVNVSARAKPNLMVVLVLAPVPLNGYLRPCTAAFVECADDHPSHAQHQEVTTAIILLAQATASTAAALWGG